jgi:hypothetical protein
LAISLCLSLAVAACRPPPPRAPRPVLPPDAAGPRVQKVREDLQVTPLEAVFSGVRGESPAEESVGIRNLGSTPVQLSAVEVVGQDAAVFRLTALPDLPVTLVPSAQVSVGIAFAPARDAAPGVRRAMLKVLLGPEREEGPPVDLSGLVLAGRYGEREPPLQQVFEALGFGVDVGAADLRLGTTADALGDEAKVSRFQRARPSPISVYPVARFGSGDRFPYGYYTGEAAPEPHPLGVVAADQDQKLNPDLEPDARTTFDPGPGTFGLFVNLGRRNTYLEDRLNTGTIRHAARLYPVRTRTGTRLPDTYAVAFETTGDGDYQDLVFVVWNVKPAP